MPRWTRTPTPSSPSTTNACGWSLTTLPAIGRHDVVTTRGRLDGDAGADHLAGEHRVGDLRQGDHPTGAGREDVGHIRSSMSSARLSASGPTTTCTTLPDATTPWAPAALSAAWSTLDGVLDLGPQPGDAGLDLDDVVGAAEAGEDLLCLAAHRVLLVGWFLPGIGAGDLGQAARGVGVQAEVAGQRLDDELGRDDRAQRGQCLGEGRPAHVHAHRRPRRPRRRRCPTTVAPRAARSRRARSSARAADRPGPRRAPPPCPRSRPRSGRGAGRRTSSRAPAAGRSPPA